MDEYSPSPYLTFSVHLDGDKERHDASVCRDGVYDKCVEVIKKALGRGFRVTVNCTLFQGENAEEVAEFMDNMMELGLKGSLFLQVTHMKELLGKMYFLNEPEAKIFSENYLN